MVRVLTVLLSERARGGASGSDRKRQKAVEELESGGVGAERGNFN
jgi:hypothetical protein